MDEYQELLQLRETVARLQDYVEYCNEKLTSESIDFLNFEEWLAFDEPDADSVEESEALEELAEI